MGWQNQFNGTKEEWKEAVRNTYQNNIISFTNNGTHLFAQINGKDVGTFSIIAQQGYIKGRD